MVAILREITRQPEIIHECHFCFVLFFLHPWFPTIRMCFLELISGILVRNKNKIVIMNIQKERSNNKYKSELVHFF